MSNRQISSLTSPIYQFTFPALGSGGAAIGTASNVLGAIPNFNISTSRIIGASSPIATNDKVFVALLSNASVTGVTPTFPILEINCSNTANVQAYTIYWIDEIAVSPLFQPPNQIRSC
jgi:hypothetical protein